MYHFPRSASSRSLDVPKEILEPDQEHALGVGQAANYDVTDDDIEVQIKGRRLNNQDNVTCKFCLFYLVWLTFSSNMFSLPKKISKLSWNYEGYHFLMWLFYVLFCTLGFW